MKIWSLFTLAAAVTAQKEVNRTKTMNRFNRATRFLNKWITENVDSRYRRFTKLRRRQGDYVKRMGWALESECSALYIDDDDVDQELEELEGGDQIGARADFGRPEIEKKIDGAMKIINTFKKLAKSNLAECRKKPLLNIKAEKLRQALKKGVTQTEKLKKKKNAANWAG